MAVNLAISDLATMLPREAFRNEVTIPTVQGTDIYAVATGTSYPVQEIIKIHYVFSSVIYNLKKIESEKEFWGQYYVLNAAQNRPYVYCPWGLDASKNKQIRVFPVPDAVYSLVIPYFADITSVMLTVSNLNSELPFLQPYLQKAIWKGARAYYLQSFDDPNAPMAMAEYEKSKVQQDAAEDADMDSDLQFRYDVGRTRYVDPATNIRLQ